MMWLLLLLVVVLGECRQQFTVYFNQDMLSLGNPFQDPTLLEDSCILKLRSHKLKSHGNSVPNIMNDHLRFFINCLAAMVLPMGPIFGYMRIARILPSHSRYSCRDHSRLLPPIPPNIFLLTMALSF